MRRWNITTRLFVCFILILDFIFFKAEIKFQIILYFLKPEITWQTEVMKVVYFLASVAYGLQPTSSPAQRIRQDMSRHRRVFPFKFWSK